MHTQAALTVLTIAAVPGLFKDLDDGTQRGQIEAAVLAVVMGAAAASIAKTSWPLIGTSLAAAYAVWRRKRRAGELSTSPGECAPAAAVVGVRSRYG